MNITMVAAVSRDGFLTKGNDPEPRHWTSAEDKTQLAKLLRSHDLHVMGSTTYDLHQPKPVADATKVILTHSPDDYTARPNLLFRSATPRQLVDEFETDFDGCLLLGGSSIYRQFLEAGLVDEIYLTVEPVTHSSGVKLIGDADFAELVDVESEVTKLNDDGTELHHFAL